MTQHVLFIVTNAATIGPEGAEYPSTDNWQPKVVVDGRLMTGQNPASAGPMAKELVAALKKLA